MKSTAIKCSCGRVTNPIQLELVKDTWIKGAYVFVEFDCPQCLKPHRMKIDIPEK